MGALTDDMIRLRRKIQAARRERGRSLAGLSSEVAAIRAEAASVLEAAGKERIERARTAQAEGRAFRRELSAQVEKLSRETQSMLGDYREELATEGLSLWDDRRRYADELRRTVAHQIEIHRQQRLQRAAQLRQEMARFRSEIRGAVASIGKGAPDAKEWVAEFRSRVAADLSSYRAEQASKAAEARAIRLEAVRTIRSRLVDLMRPIAAGRAKIIEELEGIRSAWARDIPSGENVDPGVPRTQAGDEPRSEKRADDLSSISGIGPARMGLLNQAGICSFSALARCTADEIVEILGGRVDREYAAQWIQEAVRLRGTEQQEKLDETGEE